MSHPTVFISLAAIANHLYFRKHEPSGRSVVPAIVVLVLEPFALCATFEQLSMKNLAVAYAAFYATLLSSVILYRISPFHPLAKVPGPITSKVSKLWTALYYSSGKKSLHIELKALHDKYGPVVRTGPNEVSVVDVGAVNAVLGAGGLPKGKWYKTRQDENAPGNLLTLAGEAHANRRRLWNRGFGSDSLHEYEKIIRKRASQLANAIDKDQKSSETVELTSWFNYFTFDFMADFVFGGGSETMESHSDVNGLIGLLEHHMIASSFLAHVPWLTHLGNRLWFIARYTLRMRKAAVDWSTSRVKAGATTKDLWYHLTDEAGLEKEKPPVRNVIADALTAIVAGADTTSIALSSFFWFIVSDPDCYKKLQEEVDSVYPEGSDALDVSRHSSLKFMTACLNETLRLLPPVLSGGPREVPKGSGGKLIAGYLLAEGTQVYVPAYVLHRNPEYFSPHTEEFVPSRWLSTKENQTHNVKAFIPFSYGPANCVGKNLARQEMLMVISLLMQRFEFSFADGFEWKRWPEGIRDYFATVREPLVMNVRSR